TDGIRARKIPVDYASHTSHVERIEDELARVLDGLAPHPPTIPLFSTLRADWLDTTPLDGRYWYSNLRHQVRFGESVEKLVDAGFRTFVEISAHPVLNMPVREIAEGRAGAPTVVGGSLRRNDGDLQRFLTSAAELHVRGVALDWAPALGETRPPRVELPTYPFQRRQYWLAQVQPTGAGAAGLSAADFTDPEEENDMTSSEESFAERLAGLTGEERSEALLDLVRTETAAVLGHADADEVDDDEAFFDVGFNSLTAVELRNRLAEELAVELPVMLLFDHPTPSMVAEFLLGKVAEPAAAQA
ncbi:acyltransferase domain-containing protein, partial [Streptomyces sp. NPDC006482]